MEALFEETESSEEDNDEDEEEVHSLVSGGKNLYAMGRKQSSSKSLI